mmetsp:Transcript_10906/g.19564  ORF Transcript_10906/g.19564 Transcript_10906/m.19564 type:complete len:154 (+) Transcript_10906:461-922(+)
MLHHSQEFDQMKEDEWILERHCWLLESLMVKDARKSCIIFPFEGIGFCHTQSAPASLNCVPISFPEQPMMTESMRILLIANTTSVPTITPPASSMYWSTMMTSNLSFPHTSSASSPVAASTMREWGAIPFFIRRLSIIRFILISSIIKKEIGS